MFPIFMRQNETFKPKKFILPSNQFFFQSLNFENFELILGQVFLLCLKIVIFVKFSEDHFAITFTSIFQFKERKIEIKINK